MIDGVPKELSGIREGDVLAGKYRVGRLLGTGAMGFVVAAHHLQLDEKFAIKLLHADALGDAERVARFALEARAAAKIKSEHVVRVVDVGALPSGAPYMVMEYLDGGDLDAWIEQRGPLPIAQAVEFVLQACVAVADAHALGIVHRDLKPSNLFCVRRSDGQLCIKLLDFGISKLHFSLGRGPVRFGAARAHAHASEPEAPHASGSMGSPAYMSPEQILSPAEADTRSDIWSLGVILFELLTATAPFTARTVTELVSMIATSALPSLHALRPDVPSELEAVVAKCLAKLPGERYPDVAELASALAPFASAGAAGLAARIAEIVARSRAAAARLPPPPFALSFAAPRTAPHVTVRTQRTGVAHARSRQVALGLVFATALAAFVGALWRRELDAPQQRSAQSNDAARGHGAGTRRRAPPPPPPPVFGSTPSHARTIPEHLEPAPEPRSAPAPSAVPTSRTTGRASLGAKARARSGAPSVKPEPAQAQCNPPYYFDHHGNRMFKKECV